jgi:hypothetical protein
MQLGIGTTLFPAWTAALTLVKDHGTSAVDHATKAVRAGDGSTRLDHAVRAMTSFDHAIDNTGKLPVQWFVRSAPAYFRGYEIAKQAVTLLVGSGLIPGAKERVGHQSLLAARDTFLAGVDVARSDRSRFGGRLASGWLEATAEDAATAVMLLQSGDTGRSLLAGINQVRAAVARRAGVDEGLVGAVGQLFDRAGAELTALEQAARFNPATPVDTAAFARSGELLAEVGEVAARLVTDASAASAKLEKAG